MVIRHGESALQTVGSVIGYWARKRSFQLFVIRYSLFVIHYSLSVIRGANRERPYFLAVH
jgi:hypothetical protein